jgi:hypothetical protein
VVSATGWRRRLGRAVVVVSAVAVSRAFVGVWPTSFGLAAVGMWWGLRAWAGWEARSRRGALVPQLVPAGRAGHVEFARALATVAAAYLSECEREVGGP